MLECRRPIPVVTPLGPGFIWYITSSGMYENDEYTIVLRADGTIRHFKSDQVKVYMNATYGIADGTKDDLPF